MDIFSFFKKKEDTTSSLNKDKVDLINTFRESEISYPPPSQIEKNASLEFFLKRVCVPGDSDDENYKKNFLTIYMIYIDLFSPIIRLPWGTCALSEKSLKGIFHLLLLELYKHICKCEENLENIIKEIKEKKEFYNNKNIGEKYLEYTITPEDIGFVVEVLSSKNIEILQKETQEDEKIENNIKQYYYRVDLEKLILSFFYAASEFIQVCCMTNQKGIEDFNIHINRLKDIIGSLK